VVIGAGSASFGPSSLRDAINCEGLSGSTLVLVDLDAQRLEVMARLANRLNEVSGAGLTIEHTTDRKKALPGAEFVITSIAMNREALWKLDWEIPLKHGIKQIMGENGGPGGLAHALRNIPVILDICRDMEKLCPNALLVNFSNPESRLCLAVSKHTSIKSVGLCHGIFGSIDRIRRAIGVSDINAIAAGLNHFTWMLSITRASTGEDLYPLVRRKSRESAPDEMPLTRYLLDAFGLYPSPGDDHIGEYIGYAWEIMGLKGYNFDGAREYRENLQVTIDRLLSDGDFAREYVKGRSGEIAFNIIRGILADTNELLAAVNIPNNGCITNLPSDSVVEVPAVVGANGVMGLCVGDLPDGIAAMCNTQIGVQRLVVEAAVTGSRRIALQAMLADPVVQSAEAAEKCLDELLSVHAPYLPRFG
jgi:alpha-galactosidase